MSEPTFRELARRRGIYPTAKNLRRQGCSLASAMRMLLGVDPIPTLSVRAEWPAIFEMIKRGDISPNDARRHYGLVPSRGRR